MSVSVTAGRLAAVVLTTAAAAGAATLPASAADHPGAHRAEVRISQVQHEFLGRDSRSSLALNREWVDVTNTGRRNVNLDGWTLSDEGRRTYTFHQYRLEGRATVRVHTGMGRNTRTDLYQDRRRSVWDARSDTATLRNDHGRIIDTFSWGGRREGNRSAAPWGGRHDHDHDGRSWGGRHDHDYDRGRDGASWGGRHDRDGAWWGGRHDRDRDGAWWGGRRDRDHGDYRHGNH